MKLHPIKARNLRLLEIGQFIIRYFADVESLELDLQADNDFYKIHTQLQLQSQTYNHAMKQIKAMVETKELEALDHHRNYKITTLRRAVSVFEHSDDPKELEAYATAKIIMKQYNGLEGENYEAESFDIQQLLNEWHKPEHKETVIILGLEKHLDNLKQSAAKFDELFGHRSISTVQKETYDTIALKKQMMDTYGKLVDYVTGIAAVKTDDDHYHKILDAINNGRKYFADLLARRKGHGKASGESPESESGK